MAMKSILYACALSTCAMALGSPAFAGVVGYYRTPAIHFSDSPGWGADRPGNVIVFVAEGDLWKVPLTGGVATRLTSHPGEEGMPSISPDGTTVAFTAEYEGPTEVYTMPLSGGLPTRRTWEASRIAFVGWTPDSRVLYATNAHSTLPSQQLFTINPATGARGVVPLAQAADGCYDADVATLFFTRLQFQGSHTARYKGGTAQQIWKFTDGAGEAVPLTTDYPGTSKAPMLHRGRVYFASDRDGFMNLWSMDVDGGNLRQHTRHVEFNIQSPAHSNGRIVYQLGADLWLFDVNGDRTAKLDITLESDLDQTREKWIKRPIDWITHANISPEGDRVAITARGQIFVAPAKQGRFVELPRLAVSVRGGPGGVRCRDAKFLPNADGRSSTLFALTDQSGEVEFWTFPANGVGDRKQLTTDGDVLRWEGVASPDGSKILHADKNQRLWIYDFASQSSRKFDESPIDRFTDLTWSPDGRYIAYVEQAGNLARRIKVGNVESGEITPATTDRWESYSPAWSADGKWLYFISDRNLVSTVSSPWGPLQPEPYFENRSRIYLLALTPGQRSPFEPETELRQPEAEKKKEEPKEPRPEPPTRPEPSAEPSDEAAPEPEEGKDEPKAEKKDAKKTVRVEVDPAGLETRLFEVPVPAGNYSGLWVTENTIFWMASESGQADGRSLRALKIGNEKPDIKTVASGIRSAQLSGNGKKLLIRKDSTLSIVDASPAAAELDKNAVDLSAWSLSVIPREEWRQMFVDAWRLERDYFYDPAMHGVDWNAALARYLPLVERVTSRAELSDLVAQMVSELSALHIFVSGGDFRPGTDSVFPASLGARFARDAASGGYRVVHIYAADPDLPGSLSPLARPGVEVRVGDVVTMINGVPLLEAPHHRALLRNKAGRQVLLRIKPADGGDERDVVVEPLSPQNDAGLRYDDWEYTRRMLVEELGEGDIGYVHLRAMGRPNIAEWARHYFPVFNRKGLIVDVRHNRGGNIDSWILNRLLRQPWMYWSQRVGRSPLWNMQYAFHGHVVVLCNEFTASDGEAFCDGFRRLGLGKVIGTRTWGGEIWLTSSNLLVDNGIASAAEFGVFGPEGAWLIEGHGFDPDFVVDNLPHATFNGEDAQLKAAIEHLRRRFVEEPREVPPIPAYPDKSFRP